MKPRGVRYIPLPPVVNNGGIYKIAVMLDKNEWFAIDAIAKHADLSRSLVVRRLVQLAFREPQLFEQITDEGMGK